MRYCLTIVLFISTIAVAQPKTDTILQGLFSRNNNELFQQVITQPLVYRVQIIYTQITRDKQNRPQFQNYYFNYDPSLYFNPASTVKLPLALLALEKLNKQPVKGVTKYSTALFDSSYTGQNTRYADSTAENGLPSIAQFIRKAFLVSDNDAYNRLYQFTGQQTIFKSLREKGYTNTRITRQFRGYTVEQNRHTNQVRFVKPNGDLIYLQPAGYNTDSIIFPSPIKVGKGYLNRNDSLINEPMDFTIHNNLPLGDLQQMLQSVLFPLSVPASQRFLLTNDDRQFLYRYLSQYPSETNYPNYNTTKFYDSYVKFFFRNDDHTMPEQVRVFNKVGWSYGFLTDVSYVADFKNRVEFMLSATLYVNNDGILNDDKYEYKETGHPFLYQLGQLIYQYELQRPRTYKPDLSAFKLLYTPRKKDDRPVITEVDN